MEPEPVSSVNNAARFALDGVAKNVAAPVPSPDTPVEIGKPVQLVKVPLAGVPSAGVTKVGEVANTLPPEPVSSVRAAANCADVKEPNTAALPTEVICPVRFALVVTVDALPVKAAVMVPAVKSPLASLTTIADGVFALAAVVALLLTLPAVAMVASLVSTIAAEAFMSASSIVPFSSIVLVTVPVSPTVTTLLPLLVSAPVTATVLSNVAALVTSSVPGISMLLAHSTPVPAASV